MWTAHLLKALQQHQRVHQKPRSGWNTLSSDGESLPFYRLSDLLQSNRFIASIAIFCQPASFSSR
jgi:hypothetical protein